MAVATILDIWKFPIVDPDYLHGSVIPLFWSVSGWGIYLWSYFLDTGYKSRSNER